MDKIVYTAIIDNYDNLIEVKKQEGWRYICFTNTNIESDSWEIIKIEKEDKVFRKIKLLPEEFLPPHNVSIWLDGNIEYLGTLNDLITRGHDFIVMQHPNRNSIWEEAEACIKLKKDNPEIINKQLEFFEATGYGKHYCNLVATGVLIRFTTPINRYFNQQWWRFVKEYSKRDQLSFNYVAWRQGFEYQLMPFLLNCKKYPHKKK